MYECLIHTVQLLTQRWILTHLSCKQYSLHGFYWLNNSALQIATLKDQLAQEMRKRQQYISRSVRTGDEIKDIRNILDGSLSNIIQDPSLDPILLESESKKLDASMDFHSSLQPTKLTPARRHPSPLGRSGSPSRLGRVTSTPSASSSYRSRPGPSPSPYRSKIRK